MRHHHMLTVGAMLLLDSQLALPADLAPLSGAELRERCLTYVNAPDSADSRTCAAYIRGFIEGSTQVQFHAGETAANRRESFSERALRTRLGLPSDAQPLYCVDKAVSLPEFIAQMLAHLDDHPPEDAASASDVLYGTLQRFHRCNA